MLGFYIRVTLSAEIEQKSKWRFVEKALFSLDCQSTLNSDKIASVDHVLQVRCMLQGYRSLCQLVNEPQVHGCVMN